MKSKYLYSTDNKVIIVDDTMDYSKQINKIPYESFGEMLTSGELVVIRISYNDGYTLVVDSDGDYWQVTYQQDGFLAILTKVENA